jgi:hypothetical protein
MMNANDSSCISSARKNVRVNIKISAKDSLSQHKEKHLIMVLLLFTIFDCKTKEVPRGWRKLFSQEFQDLRILLASVT